MRILHLSHSDGNSGAGRAAFKVHEALLKLDINSKMLVSKKKTNNTYVFSLNNSRINTFINKIKEFLEVKISNFLSSDKIKFVSMSCFSQLNTNKDERFLNADIINLYWVNGSFLNIKEISKIKKPIIWRLSDAWPFTGGCHYPGDCNQYEDLCLKCPQIKNLGTINFSKNILGKKLLLWNKLKITIVAPSNWIATLARKSSVFKNNKIEVIHTGVNTKIFKHRDLILSKRKLNIPIDKKVILFGGMSDTVDHRKGFQILNKSLELINTSENRNDFFVLLFGSDNIADYPVKLNKKYLGKVYSDKYLNLIYSASDVVVIPSLEDNLPNIALEALSCGKAIIGFDVCGIPDIIKHNWNGKLVKSGDYLGLAKAIKNITNNYNLRKRMEKNSRIHALKNFSLEHQAKQFLKLYKNLLKDH